MLQTSVSACVYLFNASYCASMLTPAYWASLGELLQTLSELVIIMIIISTLLHSVSACVHRMNGSLSIAFCLSSSKSSFVRRCCVPPASLRSLSSTTGKIIVLLYREIPCSTSESCSQKWLKSIDM